MRDWLRTVLELLGVVLIVAAVALVYVPAALAVAGIACLAISWRASQ
jgi:hypothetical protein